MSYYIHPIYEADTVFYISAQPDTFTFLSPKGFDEIKRSPLLPTPNEEVQAAYIGILRSKGLIDKVSQKVNKDYKQLKRDTDCRLNNEYLIELYSRDKDPEIAAEIANIYPDVFNDFLDNVSFDLISKKHVALEREIENSLQKLLEAENELRDFQSANPSIYIDKDETKLLNEKMTLLRELEKDQIDLKVIDVKITKLEELLSKEARIYISSPLIYSNPLVSKLQSQLSDIEANIEASKVDMREAHPEVLKLKAQYKEIQKDLEKEIKKIIESESKDQESFHEQLRQQLVSNLLERQSLQARITGLEATIKNLDKRILSFPNSKFRMNYLEQKVLLFRKTLDNLNLQLEEAIAQENRKMQNVIVVTPAAIPEKPAFPNMLLNILVAGLLGLIGAIFYCFFMNYIEMVKNPEREWS